MVLDIKSALRLSSGKINYHIYVHAYSTLPVGHFMPRLGFGVYQNYDATPSVLEAFKAGYRSVLIWTHATFTYVVPSSTGMSILPRFIAMKPP